jgi:hypothetical protein
MYQQVNKTATSSRISCQKEVATFERVYKPKDIRFAQEQIKNGHIKVSSSVQKAHYSRSKLFDYVKLSDVDKIVDDTLKKYNTSSEKKEENLEINYYIYENDVNDPGKKTKRSKLYAGYVVFQFYNQKQELVYQVQIDFMNKQGEDIPKRVECAIKSFMTLK